MILVDTNVLIDVLEDDPVWADWSIQQMRAQSKIHDLVINPVIYAELSQTFSTFEALDEVVEELVEIDARLVDHLPEHAVHLRHDRVAAVALDAIGADRQHARLAEQPAALRHGKRDPVEFVSGGRVDRLSIPEAHMPARPGGRASARTPSHSAANGHNQPSHCDRP